MTVRSEQGSAADHDSDKRSRELCECCGTGRCVGYRLVVWLSVVLGTISTFAGTASAHGEVGHGGTAVSFAVVVGLPVVTGLLAGIGTITVRGQDRIDQTGQYSTAVLGFLFLFFGGSLVIEAATRSLWLAFVGGTAGGVGVLWIATHSGAPQREDVCHAHLTCGAISIHRALEGLAVGALYSAGTVVGVFGAVATAGHTVLETGVLGFQYNSYRFEAIGAISIVQISYAAGAIVGVGFTTTISVTIQNAMLALAGGILCTIGVNEARNFDISRAARFI